MVIFARQNVLSDPPFSHLDLISCRNLLIYIEPSLQNAILPGFHYALEPGGFLLLGTSETIGPFTDLFEPVDKKLKVFSRKPGATPQWHLPLGKGQAAGQAEVPPAGGIGPARGATPELSAQREADRLTINQFAPPGVLVNAQLQVLQFRGLTGAYLEPPPGKAGFDLLKMARAGLMLPLRAALQQARKQRQTVRKENVRVKSDSGMRTVTLQVTPLKNLKERCCLVLFEEPGRGAAQREGTRPAASERSTRSEAPRQAARRIAELEQELAETRDYLQSLQEQYEAANEELQASNEETTSANEEMQSVNEELETSKEELESSNEELATLNEQFAGRNTELNQLNSDLNNLHANLNTAILVVGRDLTIRRFTALAEGVFNLLASDMGRPMRSLRHNLEFAGLEELLAGVIDSASAAEREVQDKAGRWFLLRACPYLTLDNTIDGAVLMLVDIDALKRAEQKAKQAHDFAQAVIEAVPPLLVLDEGLRVQVANDSFYRTFHVTPAQTENRLVYDLGNRQWDIPALRKLLEDVLPRNSSFNQFEATHEFETIGRRTMLLSGRRIEGPKTIVLSIEDITERKEAEVALGQAKDALADYSSELEHFSHALAHDMRAPLRTIHGFAGMLEEKCAGCQDASALDWLHRIKVAADRFDGLVRDALRYSETIRRELPMAPVDLAELLGGILDTYPNLQPPDVEIKWDLGNVVVMGNEAALTQVFSNLLGNAVKFVAPGVKPSVRIWAEEMRNAQCAMRNPQEVRSAECGVRNPAECPMPKPDSAPDPRPSTLDPRPSTLDPRPSTLGTVRIWVEDNGIGIPKEALAQIFGMFKRLHRESEYPGTGVGLAIVRKAAQRMGGQTGVESEVGKGSRFWIELPKATLHD